MTTNSVIEYNIQKICSHFLNFVKGNFLFVLHQLSRHPFLLIRNILEEIKIRIMLVQHSVRTGQSYKGSCKLTVFAVFIREFCCIKWSADFHKLLSVIAPLEPGLSPLNIQPQIDRHILYRNTGIQKF